MLSSTDLKKLIDDALGGETPVGRPSDRDWDSLDQLEITTHLHDELGDRVNEIEGLNSFETFDQLVSILRAEGFVE
ncbi:hypothetical protein GE115_11865 [Agromyces sp. CFH 90414]|uniref:Acyl carrier protein n=1 Tax=Agromyces agglutinans TaxID=2662258 RepID=A0A6I2FDH7_9MICO|nr:hypothetical protein [Agromyces agglutinans]MRG60556.1 hypothetical protein [Agromyces agglutinans]